MATLHTSALVQLEYSWNHTPKSPSSCNEIGVYHESNRKSKSHKISHGRLRPLKAADE